MIELFNFLSIQVNMEVTAKCPSIQTPIQVWFDMDGVLADFKESIVNNPDLIPLKKEVHTLIDNDFPEYQGLSMYELKLKLKLKLEDIDANDRLEQLNILQKNYNKQMYKIAGEPGFFANLKLMPMAVAMIKIVTEITGIKPNILSAPIGNEKDPNNYSVIEKRQWIGKYFKGLVNHIVITKNKGRVVESSRDILIDDRQTFIDDFTKAGGTGILFKDPESAMDELKHIITKLKDY